MKRLILVLLSAAMLTGCSARSQELEDSAIVKALAIDRSEKGYAVSAYIAGAEEGSVISAEAESFAEAFLLLDTRTERRIFLGQLRVVAVSSAVRNAEEPLTYLYSAEGVRSAAKVLIIKGTAKDVLEYRGLYREPAADIEKTLENAEKSANYPVVTLYGWVNCMASEAGCCILPTGKMQEENLVLDNAVIWKHFRILQTLNTQELAGSAILSEKDRVFLTAEGSSIILRDIRIEAADARITCKYRAAAGPHADLGKAVEHSIQEAVRGFLETAHKGNADFLWMRKIGEFTVTAAPVGNDYPLRGGTK